MLLGDGDSRPNSIRFDIVTCPPLGKKDKGKGKDKDEGKESPIIFYRAVSYGREVKVMFLSFSFRSVFLVSFSFFSFLPISTSLCSFSSPVISLSPDLQRRCPGSDHTADRRGSRREGWPRW